MDKRVLAVIIIIVIVIISVCIYRLTSTPLSPDGSSLTPGAGASLTTFVGRWTFGSDDYSTGNSIMINGTLDNGGSATKLQVANGGKMYAYQPQGQWYQWTGQTTADNNKNNWIMSKAPPV